MLPPISKLDKNQAMYLLRLRLHLQGGRHGDRRHGACATFSTCFGEPFLPLDPSVYAAMLADKVEKSGAKVYLVNTGWNGTGKRMKLGYTRAMVTAALTGEIEKSEFVTDSTPSACRCPPPSRAFPLGANPANTWEDKAARGELQKLAASFVENF